MVNRPQFVPPGAPDDAPYPIGYESTVPTDQMVELIKAQIEPGSYVLEVGCGSGYLASRLAEICEHVNCIEVQDFPRPELPANVTILPLGMWPLARAHDAVVISFAASDIRKVWIDHLREGGKLIIPMKVGITFPICVFRKIGTELPLTNVIAYARFTSELH